MSRVPEWLKCTEDEAGRGLGVLMACAVREDCTEEVAVALTMRRTGLSVIAACWCLEQLKTDGLIEIHETNDGRQLVLTPAGQTAHDQLFEELVAEMREAADG
jgi:CTP-dependent riboflavin kinase